MWEFALMEELMKKEIGSSTRYNKEYNKKTVKEWRERRPDDSREQNRLAAERYRKKNANNEEYLTMRRTSQAAYQRRIYAEQKAEAEADPQKLAELRAKRAQKMREYRARKKQKEQGD